MALDGWSFLGGCGVYPWYTAPLEREAAGIKQMISALQGQRAEADRLYAEFLPKWTADARTYPGAWLRAAIAALQSEIAVRERLEVLLAAGQQLHAQAVNAARDRVAKIEAEARQRLDLPDGVITPPALLQVTPGWHRARAEVLALESADLSREVRDNLDALGRAQRRLTKWTQDLAAADQLQEKRRREAEAAAGRAALQEQEDPREVKRAALAAAVDRLLAPVRGKRREAAN